MAKRGRPHSRVKKEKMVICVYEKERIQFDNLCAELHLTRQETLRYLVNLHQQKAIGHWAEAPAAANVAETSATTTPSSCRNKGFNFVQLSLSIPKRTWQRYIHFFQIRFATWAMKTHEEKLSILLEMAEQWRPDGATKTAETPTAISTYDKTKPNQVSDGQSILPLMPPQTPSLDLRPEKPPTTPEKHSGMPKFDQTPNFDTEQSQRGNSNGQSSDMITGWRIRFQKEVANAGFAPVVMESGHANSARNEIAAREENAELADSVNSVISKPCSQFQDQSIGNGVEGKEARLQEEMENNQQTAAIPSHYGNAMGSGIEAALEADQPVLSAELADSINRLIYRPSGQGQWIGANVSALGRAMVAAARVPEPEQRPEIAVGTETVAVTERSEQSFATLEPKDKNLDSSMQPDLASFRNTETAMNVESNRALPLSNNQHVSVITNENRPLGVKNGVRRHRFPIFAPKSLQDLYKNFFEINGWSAKSDGEKLGILLGLAETHPNYSKKKHDFNLTKAIGNCRVPCYNRQTAAQLEGQVTASNAATWSMDIELTNSLWNRVQRFTSIAGWTSLSNGEKLWMLLELAQTHPFFNSEQGIERNVTASGDLYTRYNEFFAFHGWHQERHESRLRILLDLAESHHALAQTGLSNDSEKIKSCIGKLANRKPKKRGRTPEEDEYSDDSDGSWHDGVSPRIRINGKAPPRRVAINPQSEIQMSEELKKKYAGFFARNGWSKLETGTKISILFSLAESHPDLSDNWRDLPTFDIRTVRVASPFDTDRAPQTTFAVRISMTPDVKQRWTRFFEKHGWSRKTKAQQLEILLELANTHPAFFEDGQERPNFDKERFSNIQTEDDIDGDPDCDIKEKRNAIRQLKDIQNNQLRLLKPDYYLKFSEEARNQRPHGSKRSYAELANTRRHIVERRQLKQLIAGCMCKHDGCTALIDYKSIRTVEAGFVIKVTAHCSAEANHLFSWASSVIMKHTATQLLGKYYVLNTTVSAAIEMSGNNPTKMEHFARILHLTWPTSKLRNAAKGSCMVVARRCFDATQQEMLETLKQQSQGQIVLAGDGQFDSPGSCAKLCVYSLMVLGVDEKKDDGSHQLKQCGYIINQAVIDCRHAENKSTNMERVGLHWALQPLIQAGLNVAELATDDHMQIVADFRKIREASEERAANNANNDDEDAALKKFQESLAAALMHFKPPIDVGRNILSLLSFYNRIVHSNDIWHKAKNLLKAVSAIAGSAPSKEQQCYRKYAKMLRNYLWECAQGAGGKAETFVELWSAVERHLKDDHSRCGAVDLHSKTKLMGKLDQTTNAFTRLLTCLHRVANDANQLCRFRKTGQLEAYNALTLKYCPKRVPLVYDVMLFRRDLAALDHNHHVLRPYKETRDGAMRVSRIWRKSTKAYSLSFHKVDKDYAYVDHMMAAVLLHRHTVHLGRYHLPKSASDPTLIQATLAPKRQSLKQICSQWLAKQRGAKINKIQDARKVEKKGKKRKIDSETSSKNDVEEWKSDASNQSEGESSDGGECREDSADEWVPGTSSGALKGKRTAITKRKRKANFEEGANAPARKTTRKNVPKRVQRRKRARVDSTSSSGDEAE